MLGVVNLAAVAFAVDPMMEAWHATGHAALAVAFALWAQHLRQARAEQSEQGQLEPADAISEFEGEMDMMRQELNEMQERVDFAERMLAQRPEPRPQDPRGQAEP
ncbi:MAG: hypothetical protein V4503_09725 [Gemmatimonadota bacterium]